MPTRPIPLPANATLTLPNGTTLRTSGVTGTATHWTNTGSRLRGWKLPAEEDNTERLLAAMEELDVHEQETIHLDVDLVAAGDDTATLEPQPPPVNHEQVVLYQDESGVLSWHFAVGAIAASEAGGARLRSASARRSFTIPMRTAGARQALRAEPAPARLRGFITKLGRKVFKVLVLPIVSEWLGAPLRSLAAKIESRYRRELIRPLTAENYRRVVANEFTGWDTLRGQRALLVVHGIFSSTEAMLSRLPEPAMRTLAEHYGRRVIALDQLTVSRSPEDNARGFLEKATAALGRDGAEFDILCHSRGGIVSRALVERGQALVPGHTCRFRKVFFAASPNRGSMLADPEHMVEMIDAFTNLATEFPDGWMTYALELLLGLVKAVVHSGERHLPGVAAMSTLSDQYVPATLNSATYGALPPTCDYAAVASDFDPTAESGVAWRLANSLVDRVFHTTRGPIANDLVVPCDGVFDQNGHPWFPIGKRLVFAREDGVKHTDFFAQRGVIDAIGWHFGLAGAEPPAGMLLPAEGSRLRAPAGGQTVPPQREAAPEQPSAEALRKPELYYHECIEAGKTGPLDVALAALTAAQPGALRVALGAEGTATLSVSLSAPGFDIVGLDTLPLVVHGQPGGPGEKVTFTVTPRDPGAVPVLRELRAVFWQGTALLGSVCHYTAVTPVGWAGPLPKGYGEKADTGVRTRSAPRRDCELVVNVTGDKDEGVSPFNLSLRSAIHGQSYESRRGGKYHSPSGSDSLEKYLDTFFQVQFATYPADSLSEVAFAAALPGWEQNFIAALRDLGRTLWDWLPAEFRVEYLRLHVAGALPPSILVASEEMVLPWELVIPRDEKGNNLPALGHAHVIGRWHPNWLKKPEPQRLRVRTACLLAPSYTGRLRLRQAGNEAGVVQKWLPRIRPNTAPNLLTVRHEVLDSTDMQLLHFVGHGEFKAESADESALVLADTSLLKARSFTGSALAAKASPILYLNACGVGQTARNVGRPGGFAANFLRSGGTGVIAPYWPVNDADAVRFADELYRSLLRQRSVGEALRELRAANENNSTFQAFAWFGDPWASLDLAELAA